MTELFTSVDPVMSKKMFRHFLDAHKGVSINKTQTNQPTESVREELNQLQEQFTTLITELERLKAQKQQETDTIPTQTKKELSYNERQSLLENVYLLERKVKLLQEQPSYNKKIIETLRSRISSIKEKLK